MRANPPVNADARDVPATAKVVGARAGYRERFRCRCKHQC
jgi:hypothetical protein